MTCWMSALLFGRRFLGLQFQCWRQLIPNIDCFLFLHIGHLFRSVHNPHRPSSSSNRPKIQDGRPILQCERRVMAQPWPSLSLFALN